MENGASSIKTMGERHPDTISTSSNLAATYFALEKYPKAREIQTEVLSLRKQLLGEHHPDTIKASENLAMTCRTLGRLGQARELQEEVLRILGGPPARHHSYNRPGRGSSQTRR
jgi:tetratricopeptide (TPR) repeat protein